MADEVVEEKVTETPPVEEAKQEELPLVAATEKVSEAEPVAEEKTEEKAAEEVKVDWRDRELKAKHAQILRAREKEQELQAEIDAQRAQLAKFNQGKTEETPVIPVDEVERRVQERLAQQTYVEKSNAIDAEGKKTYGDGWQQAVENLTILGGFDMATMNGVLATDDPAKVLYELGKNPDKFQELKALPLERRIIEMSKIAMSTVTKPVSNAPAPVSPVGGRAAPAKETLNDNMDDDKWFSIRRQQRLAKFQATHSPRR